MARVETLLLSILLVMVKSSSSLQPDYTRYWIQFYETIPAQDTTAFQPARDPVRYKGIGYVKHNNVLHTSNGYQVGSVGGLYFYHSTDAIEDVVTITFSKSLSGIWSGSSISLRGYWIMTPDGNADVDREELAIVGGQGGFRGATGTVYYRKVAKQPNTIFLVTCDIYVPNGWNLVPKTYVDLEHEFGSLRDAVKVQPEFRNFTESISAFDILEQVVK